MASASAPTGHEEHRSGAVRRIVAGDGAAGAVGRDSGDQATHLGGEGVGHTRRLASGEQICGLGADGRCRVPIEREHPIVERHEGVELSADLLEVCPLWSIQPGLDPCEAGPELGHRSEEQSPARYGVRIDAGGPANGFQRVGVLPAVDVGGEPLQLQELAAGVQFGDGRVQRTALRPDDRQAREHDSQQQCGGEAEGGPESKPDTGVVK